MSVYRCLDCGAEFDEPKSENEYRGECWGVPSYETMYYCPVCGGDYEEMPPEEDEEE